MTLAPWIRKCYLMTMTLADLISLTERMKVGSPPQAIPIDEIRVLVEIDGRRLDVAPKDVSIGALASGEPFVCVQVAGPSVRQTIREIEAARDDLDRTLARLRSKTPA